MKEARLVLTFVCLSVCLLGHIRSYELILMKFLEGWGVAKDQLI